MPSKVLGLFIICLVFRVDGFSQVSFLDTNVVIKVHGSIMSNKIVTKSELLNTGFLKTLSLTCRSKHLNLISKIKDSIDCLITVKKIELITKKKSFYCDLISISTNDSNLISIFKEFTNDFYYDCFTGECKTEFGYMFIQSINLNVVQALKIKNRTQKEIYKIIKRK